MILAALIRKEYREIVRDRVTISIAIFLPLVLLFLFGYGVSLDVEDISLAVYDQDRSQESARLTEAFTANGYFRLKHQLTSHSQVDEVLDSGTATAVLVIPPDYATMIRKDKPVRVQVLIDGSFSATALIVSNYAMSIIERYSTGLAYSRISEQGYPIPERVQLISRVWYNAPMKSVNYIVPGLFAVLLMAFPPMLTALSIVREKERGTIEQIYVSPITPALFILGKIVPYATIAFLEMLLILGVGTLWFHIPFRGSFPLLMGASLLYVLVTVGMGVFVSTITRTQLGAVLLSLVATLMPSFLFSGFLFPIATMPYMMQLYTFIFPVRYFNDISRDLFLKGVGLEFLWTNVLLLAVYAVVLFLLATLRLKKKVA
jgi:ABC-2 type transport system permease protein